MDIIVLLGILVVVTIIIGIPYLGFSLPRKYGHRKTGIVLGSILAVFMFILVYPEPFLNLFFTKNDARELFAQQNFEIQKEFKILDNQYNQWKSDSRVLVLHISPEDRDAFIAKIRNAPNLNKAGWPASSEEIAERYFGNPVNFNFELPDAWVCQSFVRANKQGYAPKWQAITISKTENRLQFKEWYE